MKNVRHMLVFCQIVESGSLTAAASRLSLSKSVLSQQLKALEQELGVSLLNRNTRSQTLTSAGQAFYEQCREVGRLIDQAWDIARDSQQLALGTLRLTAPNALIESIVGPAVGALVAQHPGITPILLSEDTRAHLIKDDIHLAIRVGKMASSEFKQRKLGSFRDVLCASPSYLSQNPLQIESLSMRPPQSPALHYIANAWQGTQIRHRLTPKAGGRAIYLQFTATRYCNSLPAVIALCQEGCGLAYIPEFVFRAHAHSGALVEALPDYTCETADIYAVHAFAGNPPTLVRLAIDAIRLRIDQLIKTP